MTRTDLLMIAPLSDAVVDALSADFTVHRYDQAEDRAALLAEIGPTVRAVATDGHHGCPHEIAERLPKLDIVASYGVGYDAIDIEAMRARKIQVTNTPDVLNDAVAELALGMMIGLCRRLADADRFVRDGRWRAGTYPLTGELSGKTLGIVGLGRIGKEIARRCQVMNMQVVYHGRQRQAHQPYPYYPDLTAMARDVDWLVVCVPGSASTHGLIDAEVLRALGAEGNLVNVARGAVVDEAALVALLQDGQLGGAALDVFVDEPRVPPALFALTNVLLSPHQGSATHKTRAAMGDLVVRNLRAYLKGLPLLTPVA